jgi:hypothetical protein
MSIYTVHSRPDDEPDTVVLVGEGFSWPAFAFTALWALTKGLWLAAFILVCLFALIASAASILRLGDGAALALQVAVSTILGLEAHNIRRWSLGRAGYREVATVGGNSLTEAELAYFCMTRAVRQSPGNGRTSHSAEYDRLGMSGET